MRYSILVIALFVGACVHGGGGLYSSYAGSVPEAEALVYAEAAADYVSSTIARDGRPISLEAAKNDTVLGPKIQSAIEKRGVVVFRCDR